jgi:hypothetical protein
MKPKDVELHDALINRTAIDFNEGTMSIELDYYPDPVNSSERSPLTISFSGVENISGLADLKDLENNRFAGNVSYWKPKAKKGTTYIYLAGGALAITAKSLKVKAYPTKGKRKNLRSSKI